MRRLFAAALLALAASAAIAQESWPARQVRIIVPSSPGGGTDVYGRVLAQGLSEALGQSVVVDNRPGASGNIGAELVAKAAPDGYTLLVSANASIAIGPHLYKKLPFDVERDFVPVARGVRGVLALTVQPTVSARSVRELVELGKREPNKYSHGSAGTGTPTFLGIRMLEEASGAQFLHVPFKGMGQAYQSFLSGAIQFMLPDLASALPHIRAGKAIPLAVTEKTRHLGAVPTFPEAGFPTVDVPGSFSVLAPAGTPAAIVQRVSSEVQKVMRQPAVAERLDALALIPVFDTPEEFAQSLRKEREMWGALIRRNGITAEQ